MTAEPAPAPDTDERPDDPDPGGSPGGRARWVRGELGYLAEIAGLSGFAVAQPILSSFGESPETFVSVGADPGQIVRFALVVALLPILVLWLPLLPTRLLGPSARRWSQVLVVGLLGAAAGAVISRGVGASGVGRLGAALAVGGGIGFLRAREWPPVRLFLRYTAPFPVLLAGLFLFASPVATLVRPSEATATDTSGIDTSTDRPPVVFIVLDELPTSSLLDGTGAIDRNRFPNIARMADTSTWYRNHTSNAAATLQSIPVLLTGRLPEDAAAQDFAIHDNFPDNLFTLLGDSYEVNAHEQGTRMCPPSICRRSSELTIDDEALELTVAPPEVISDPVGTLLDQAWSMWRNEAWPPSAGFDGGYKLGGEGAAITQEAVANALRSVTSIQPPNGDEPVLDYVHLALPHQPWYLLPSGRTHDAPEIPFGNEFMRYWPEGDLGLDLARAGEMQMQMQLQWADRVVGEMIDRLQELDRWDDALVVLTADHGFSFEPATSARVATDGNQRSLAWAPLIVKLPDQTEPQVLDDAVMGLDVLPTILDVVDIEAPWELEGVSLVDGPPPTDRQRPFVIVVDSDFETMLRERIAVLDADGLTPLLTAGRSFDPDDELGAWRHGRRGDLIGRAVDDLGVCRGEGPPLALDVSDGWKDLVAGRLDEADPLPLWHQGIVRVEKMIDAAAAVDGRIVAWGATANFGGDNRLGLLFAEPLVRTPTGDPTYYEVVDEPGCQLRPFAGQPRG